MHRRAYSFLIGNAVLMGMLAVIAAVALDRPLLDPDGFLGPAWLRLPLIVLGAFAIDVLPRMFWRSRMRPTSMREVFLERWRTHWTHDRIVLVVVGIICFYVTYVSYRNLKSYLPFVNETTYDRQLRRLDQLLFLGNEPAIVLHDILGSGATAHVLSSIYLWFLPLVPLTVGAFLVFSRNVSFGYWFVTSQCLAWTLGTASYYALPTLGPGFEYSYLYVDLATSGSESLLDALSYGRQDVRVFSDVPVFNVGDAVQSVAGFASLHTAITMLLALMVQYTVRIRVLHWILWVNFGITVVATLYFGWHYIADDIGGIAIALISFYVGGVASGQSFDRHGMASHPTTTTSSVPVSD